MARRKPPPAGAKRGRKPLLENRPDRDQLLAEMIAPGANMTAISRRIGVSTDALTAFRDKWCPKPIRDLLNRHDSRALEAAQVDVLSKFIDSIEKSHQMLLAADEWLRDPSDRSKYNLNPRTHEVEIVYEERPSALRDPCSACKHQARETTGLIPVRKTAKLSDLMRAVELGLGIAIVKGEAKTADARKLLLEAVATMKPVLEIYGRNTGQLRAADPAVVINQVIADPEWRTRVQRVRDAVARIRTAHPELIAELDAALSGLAGDAPRLLGAGGR